MIIFKDEDRFPWCYKDNVSRVINALHRVIPSTTEEKLNESKVRRHVIKTDTVVIDMADKTPCVYRLIDKTGRWTLPEVVAPQNANLYKGSVLVHGFRTPALGNWTSYLGHDDDNPVDVYETYLQPHGYSCDRAVVEDLSGERRRPKDRLLVLHMYRTFITGESPCMLVTTYSDGMFCVLCGSRRNVFRATRCGDEETYCSSECAVVRLKMKEMIRIGQYTPFSLRVPRMSMINAVGALVLMQDLLDNVQITRHGANDRIYHADVFNLKIEPTKLPILFSGVSSDQRRSWLEYIQDCMMGKRTSVLLIPRLQLMKLLETDELTTEQESWLLDGFLCLFVHPVTKQPLTGFTSVLSRNECPFCRYCGRVRNFVKKLYACKGCKKEWYCDQICQKKDRKYHKRFCTDDIDAAAMFMELFPHSYRCTECMLVFTDALDFRAHVRSEHKGQGPSTSVAAARTDDYRLALPVSDVDMADANPPLSLECDKDGVKHLPLSRSQKKELKKALREPRKVELKLTTTCGTAKDSRPQGKDRPVCPKVSARDYRGNICCGPTA